MPETPAEMSSSSKAKRRWLKALLVTGLLLVALGGGAWVAIDLLGKALWREHPSELEAAGFSVDPSLAFTPAVEGTFWADPFVRGMTDGEIPGLRERFEELLKSDPHHDPMAVVRNVETVRRSSLSRGESFEVFDAELGLDPKESAERVMAIMRELDEDVDRFRDALRLAPSSPFPNLSVFDADIEFPAAVAVDPLRLLSLRARCLLKLGHLREALDDIEDAFRLHRHLEADPVLIDCLIISASTSSLLRVVWDGLERGLWDTTSLETLDRLFVERIDEYHGFASVVRCELCYTHAVRTRWFASGLPDEIDGVPFDQPPQTFHRPDWLPEWRWIAASQDFLDGLAWRTLPPGALFAAFVDFDRWVVGTLLNPEIPLGERIDSLEKILPENRIMGFRNPGFEFAFSSAYGFGAAFSRYEDAKALLHLARAAVAAERFRLDTGGYPGAWEDFVPRWLGSVPADPWSGGSLIYRLDEEGRPVIYSVGRNGIDNDGVSKSRTEGDLVWRYSAVE